LEAYSTSPDPLTGFIGLGKGDEGIGGLEQRRGGEGRGQKGM